MKRKLYLASAVGVILFSLLIKDAILADSKPDSPRNSADGPPVLTHTSENDSNDGSLPLTERPDQLREPVPGTNHLRILANLVSDEGTPVQGATVVTTLFGKTTETTVPDSGRLQVDVKVTKPLAASMPLYFDIRAPGKQRVFLNHILPRDTKHFDMGEIRFNGGGVVLGTVQDENGNPVEGALVTPLTRPAPLLTLSAEQRLWGRLKSHPHLHSRTDSQGTFRLDGVSAGAMQVAAHKAGFEWSVSQPFQIDKVNPVKIVMSLARLATDQIIRGTVISANERPVEEAMVYLVPDGNGHIDDRHYVVVTSSAGEFLLPAQRGISYQLLVKSDNDIIGRIGKVTASAVPLIVRADYFRTRLSILTQPFVERLDRVEVVITDSSRRTLGTRQLESCQVDCELLLPRESSHLFVASRNYHPAWVPVSHDADSVQVVLSRSAVVTGVVSHGGLPVLGASVHLHPLDSSQSTCYVPGPLNVRLPVLANVNEIVTGPDGAFELPVHKNGRYVVHATQERYGTASSNAFEVTEGVSTAPVTLTFSVPANLVGSVLLPPMAEPWSGLLVATQGDGHYRSVRVGSVNPHYTLGPLSPGPWQIKICSVIYEDWFSMGRSYNPTMEVPFAPTIILGAGQSAALDLDHSSRLIVTLVGDLGTSWSLSLQSDTVGIIRGQAATDGSLYSEPMPPGTYQVMAICTQHGFEFIAQSVRQCGPGNTAVELHASRQALTLEGLKAGVEYAATGVINEWSWSYRFTADAGREYNLPAGVVSVREKKGGDSVLLPTRMR